MVSATEVSEVLGTEASLVVVTEASVVVAPFGVVSTELGVEQDATSKSGIAATTRWAKDTAASCGGSSLNAKTGNPNRSGREARSRRYVSPLGTRL